MDNLTHTLIGVTLGRSVKARTPQIEKAALWTSVIGNNLPDFDFFWTTSGLDGNLGYLLQHRGYTHTLVFSIPLGILSAWLGMRISGLKDNKEWKLFPLGIAAALLHVFFDWNNNYGVHPFFPFWNQWIYGDNLFIVEPALWLSILPLVFFSSRFAISRGLALGWGIFTLGLIWLRVFMPTSVCLVLTVWAGAMIAVQWKSTSTRFAWTGISIVLLIFGVSSSVTKRHLTGVLQSRAPNEKVYQIALTPAPSNPFCWHFVSLSIREKAEYIARVGVLNHLPAFYSGKECYFLDRTLKLKGLEDLKDTDGAEITWKGEFRRPFEEFESLHKNSCQFQAFLKFARIPFWWTEGETTFSSDLRYSRQGVSDFARVRLNASSLCPKELPPWTPPTFQITVQ